MTACDYIDAWSDINILTDTNRSIATNNQYFMANPCVLANYQLTG